MRFKRLARREPVFFQCELNELPFNNAKPSKLDKIEEEKQFWLYTIPKQKISSSLTHKAHKQISINLSSARKSQYPKEKSCKLISAFLLRSEVSRKHL